MKKAAIVITTYNRKEMADRCIESLLQSDAKKIDIYLIDNAGVDGTREYIRKKYKTAVKTYRIKKNLGGCNGFNFGAMKALKHGYEHIVLCDDDIVVEPDTISKMINFMDNHPEAGIVGPRTHHMADKRLMQEYGTYLSWGKAFDIRVDNYSKLWDEKECEPWIYVDYIPACFMMVRSSIMKQVGGVPTYYGGYFEDIDLGHRAILLGYRIAVDSSAVIYHGKVSANGPVKDSTVKDYFMNRSKVLFYARYTPNDQLEKMCRKYLAKMYEQMMTARYRGDDNLFRIITRAYIDGFRGTLGPLSLNEVAFEKKKYDRFTELVDGKSAVLIDHYRDEYFIGDLLRTTRGTIYVKGENLSKLFSEITRFGFSENDINRLKEYTGNEQYDLHIRFFSWLGDVDLNEDCVYVDWYKNVAETKEEREFFSTVASQKGLFVDMYYKMVVQQVLRARRSWHKKKQYKFLSDEDLIKYGLEVCEDRIIKAINF